MSGKNKNLNNSVVIVDEKSKKMENEDMMNLLTKMNSKIEDMEKKMNRVLQVVEGQKEKIGKLEKELAKEKEENKKMREEFAESKEMISELQQRQRLNNIIINGVKQERNEDVYKIIETLGNRLGIVDCMKDVQTAHRVGTLAKNKIKPIVVRLSNSSTRDKWTAAFRAKQLWKEKVYINEHLTKSNQDLFYNAKKLKQVNGYKFVWVKDCKIRIRKNETSRIYVIRTLKDLDTYMTLQPPPSLLSEQGDEYLSANSSNSNFSS
uniref:FP protein C-terminal domain-containing protein n=1 Tax=Cacopsylla melanoneura TaxID=428564 RepID=A0A8D8XMK6_9HEMI